MGSKRTEDEDFIRALSDFSGLMFERAGFTPKSPVDPDTCTTPAHDHAAIALDQRTQSREDTYLDICACRIDTPGKARAYGAVIRLLLHQAPDFAMYSTYKLIQEHTLSVSTKSKRVKVRRDDISFILNTFFPVSGEEVTDSGSSERSEDGGSATPPATLHVSIPNAVRMRSEADAVTSTSMFTREPGFKDPGFSQGIATRITSLVDAPAPSEKLRVLHSVPFCVCAGQVPFVDCACSGSGCVSVQGRWGLDLAMPSFYDLLEEQTPVVVEIAGAPAIRPVVRGKTKPKKLHDLAYEWGHPLYRGTAKTRFTKKAKKLALELGLSWEAKTVIDKPWDGESTFSHQEYLLRGTEEQFAALGFALRGSKASVPFEPSSLRSELPLSPQWMFDLIDPGTGPKTPSPEPGKSGWVWNEKLGWLDARPSWEKKKPSPKLTFAELVALDASLNPRDGNTGIREDREVTTEGNSVIRKTGEGRQIHRSKVSLACPEHLVVIEGDGCVQPPGTETTKGGTHRT